MGPSDVAATLAEVRSSLGVVAAASGRSSALIRARSAGNGSAAPADGLLSALAERIDGVRAEVGRLATLLDRAEGRLTSRASADEDGRPEGDAVAEPDDEEAAAVMDEIRALVALLAGAGASPHEIAAWVFREHGVVVSDRVIEDVGHERQPPG